MNVKTLLLSVFTLLAATTARADVEINETNFPDENFRNYLLNDRFGKDGVLTDAEISRFTILTVTGKGIQSLKGIELFTALKTLRCAENQLSELNLSQNTALMTLDCHNNQLTSLEVTGCANLKDLECYQNQIKGAAMDALVESLPSITRGIMRVIYNENEGNVITNMQVAAAKAKGWTVQSYIYSWQEFAGTFEDVAINEENFPDENFRNYILSQPYGEDGVLTDAEVTGFNGVRYIYVSSMDIKSLKGVEHFPELSALYCDRNQLTELDLSKNQNLENLDCGNNQLTSLDVSNNTKLVYLYCYTNKLTELDVSNNQQLRNVIIYQNQIYGEAMSALVESLPTITDLGRMYVVDNENEQNVITPQQVAVAKAKGWLSYYKDENGNVQECVSDDPITTDITINAINIPGASLRDYLLSQPYGADGVLTAEEIAGITKIIINGRYAYDVRGIEHLTELTYFDCSENRLTELDLSKNTALELLYCYNNQLTSLNVSGCAALTTLACDNNQLTALDVSDCAALTKLWCNKNQIMGAAMDALIESLPTISSGKGALCVIREEEESNEIEWNVMTTVQVEAAKSKDWTPKCWDSSNRRWVDYAGSDPNVAGVEINETTFPDENFRKWVLSQPFGIDALLTDTEVAKVKDMGVYNQGVQNLKGIEYFTALSFLGCGNNQLVTLDLSKNDALLELDCSCNQIKGAGMDALIESLSAINNGRMYVIFNENEGNEITKTQVEAAKSKGWTPYAFNGINWLEYPGSEPDVEPIIVETEVAISNLNDEDISDNVVDGIYYNLDEESGSGYSMEQNCIVIGQTTDISLVGTGEPGSEEVKENFTGIILEVGSGTGTISIDAETFGTTCLAVRIGDDTPSIVSCEGRKDVYVGYNVAEPTYVYIYTVSQDASPAKVWRAPAIGENALLIYGVKITPSDSGDAISNVKIGNKNDNLWYDLNGKLIVKPRQSGMFIHNGKKVAVK